MNKLTVFLSLLSLPGFGQIAADIHASDTPSPSAFVGRNRAVTESNQTPGKHNLVVISQRKLKGECASEGLALIEQRNQMADDSLLYDWYDASYQKLLATDRCGTEVYRSESWNLVTNAGLNWLADIMSNTSTPSVNAQCNYIALTNTAITPAAGDTTLSGEIVANGLSRAQATYAHSANATTYTLSKTFTATGTQSAQAGAVFTASSAGTMCFEDTFTAASLATNDTLTVTWTVTI